MLTTSSSVFLSFYFVPVLPWSCQKYIRLWWEEKSIFYLDFSCIDDEVFTHLNNMASFIFNQKAKVALHCKMIFWNVFCILKGQNSNFKVVYVKHEIEVDKCDLWPIYSC